MMLKLLLLAGIFAPSPARAQFERVNVEERIRREANPPDDLVSQPAPPKSAQELWDTYVDLGTGFDPAIAELYADDAVIRNIRRYPDGRSRVVQMTGLEYKALIRHAMPVARSRGDVDVYSDVQFEPLGERTRIRATRYSTLKKYRAPHELVVGNPGGGGWKILEENGESRP